MKLEIKSTITFLKVSGTGTGTGTGTESMK
jgi:hypothetical protein